MGLLDTLFGDTDEQQAEYQSSSGPDVQTVPRPIQGNEHAVARYRFALRTAPPEQLDRINLEAFAHLTPDQRHLALQLMEQIIPKNEANRLTEDPRSLAAAASRAEIHQPGAVERIFGGLNAVGRPQPNYGAGFAGSGVGMASIGVGSVVSGNLFSALAGAFMVSPLAQDFFADPAREQTFLGSPEATELEGGTIAFDSDAFLVPEPAETEERHDELALEAGYGATDGAGGAEFGGYGTDV